MDTGFKSVHEVRSVMQRSAKTVQFSIKNGMACGKGKRGVLRMGGKPRWQFLLKQLVSIRTKGRAESNLPGTSKEILSPRIGQLQTSTDINFRSQMQG